MPEKRKESVFGLLRKSRILVETKLLQTAASLRTLFFYVVSIILCLPHHAREGNRETWLPKSFQIVFTFESDTSKSGLCRPSHRTEEQKDRAKRPILASSSFHRGELGILKRGEKGQECIIGPISADRGSRWCDPLQRPFLRADAWNQFAP
jgi:hypothetical protein